MTADLVRRTGPATSAVASVPAERPVARIRLQASAMAGLSTLQQIVDYLTPLLASAPGVKDALIAAAALDGLTL